MGERNGVLIVVAALILGACIVAGGLIVQSAINNTATQIAGVRAELNALQSSLQAAAPAPQPARAQRPDPNRRYKINIAGSPSVGPKDAKVTIVEFSDFQCPFCAKVVPTIHQIEKEYDGQVRVVFKHLPLSIHSKAKPAALAAEAAYRQGKFWQMYDLIFANRNEMSPEKYVEYAAQLGLDVDRFKRDMASADVRRKVDADAAEAASLGVTGTPAFFINGKFLSGARPFDSFKKVIDEELKQG